MSNMAVFFTRGVSLQMWLESGLFYREKNIYEQHLKKNNYKKIYWLTYGVNDKKISESLKEKGELDKNIYVLEMPEKYNSKLGMFIYSIKMVSIYKKGLKSCVIKKTNQMDGAWSAYYAKKKTGGVFSLRTGYTLSAFTDNNNNIKYIKKKIIHFIEKYLYTKADVAFVSSKHDKNYIVDNYGIDADKIDILRNYIDTNIFYNRKNIDEKNEFVFVGRLNEQKNLFNTIKAVNNAGMKLNIYGNGELKKDLELFIKKNNFNCELKGYIANSELPVVLNEYKYFILASHIEGMPKSLLEAMACGRICVGTDVDGINELIINGKTGILASDTSEKSIIEALHTVISINEKDNIASNAEQLIRELYSLGSIVEIEMRAYSRYEE